MEMESKLYTPAEIRDLHDVVEILRAGREELLRDWVERVRDNQAIKSGETLSDPLLLDHLPQIYDAILDRLEVNRPREDAEQFAAVHGFTRRITGYDVLETVIELLVFRHSIWAHLTAVNAPVDGAYVAMERIDGMVDRTVIASLRAFLDPAAKMLVRKPAATGASDGATEPPPQAEPDPGM
jgi:hypothetical protein